MINKTDSGKYIWITQCPFTIKNEQITFYKEYISTQWRLLYNKSTGNSYYMEKKWNLFLWNLEQDKHNSLITFIQPDTGTTR